MTVLISNPCAPACIICLLECETCITQSVALNLAEHQKCIANCRDCADICALCARIEVRGSGLALSLRKICADICLACALECATHTEHEWCQTCAAACRACATACAA
jgi:hypothetical protein